MLPRRSDECEEGAGHQTASCDGEFMRVEGGRESFGALEGLNGVNMTK